MLQCLQEELQLCDICNELCEFDQIALTLDSCLDIELPGKICCAKHKADGEPLPILNSNVNLKSVALAHLDLRMHFAMSIYYY